MPHEVNILMPKSPRMWDILEQIFKSCMFSMVRWLLFCSLVFVVVIVFCCFSLFLQNSFLAGTHQTQLHSKICKHQIFTELISVLPVIVPFLVTHYFLLVSGIPPSLLLQNGIVASLRTSSQKFVFQFSLVTKK